MVKVQIEEILEHLDTEMRRALKAALKRVHPECEVDERKLFRAFKRAVGRKCATWERIPDRYVRTD